MNAKTLSILFFSVLFFISGPAHADAIPDEAWVAITFTDKGADQAPTEYYGSVDRKRFADMLSNPAPTGFIKLNHVAFLSPSGRLVPLSELRGNVKQGYSRSMYFRVESIIRIIELDAQFVKDNAFDLTERK